MNNLLLFFIIFLPVCVQSKVPKKLQQGDTIGIVQLSNAITDFKEALQAIMYLHQLGFKIKVAPNVYENEYYFSGSAEDRARSLEQFFADPEIAAIMPVRGGYGSIHVIDLLDYDIIKQNPKIFIGYSDLTALEWAIYKKTGLVTFHGPMAVSFAREQDPTETVNSMLSLLCEDNMEIVQGFSILYPECEHEKPARFEHCDNMVESTSPVASVPDSVEGVLVGGNFATFMSLMGTPYEIDLKGKILFIEEINERVMSIDRMLAQLLLSSKMNGVKAVIFGYMTNMIKRDPFEKDGYTTIKDLLSPLNVPIITGIASGHSYPMHSLPMGAKVRLNFHEKTITLLEPVLK